MRQPPSSHRVGADGLAFKGSQRHLQTYVNERRPELDSAIRRALPALPAHEIQWRSPLRGDSYREYRDDDFLRRVEAGDLTSSLREFWPRRGPVWDGLATVPSGERPGVILVEAKSYPAEMASACRATPRSRATIERALDAARAGLGAEGDRTAWTDRYYQLANRIAHLWWLRQQGRDAWLLLVCFTGDAGPRRTGETAWRAATEAALSSLGLADTTSHGIVELYLPAP